MPEHASEVEHSVRPRKPRTLGGIIYLGMLFTHLVGLLLIVFGAWRQGLLVMGLAFLVGALARLLLDDARAGMLAIRRKAVNVGTLGGLGAALVAMSFLVRDWPRK